MKAPIHPPRECERCDSLREEQAHHISRTAVEHPSHYNFGKFEVIDVIEDWGLDFHLGNAVKYIARAGKKDPAKEVEDLKKAQWYINRKLGSLGEQDRVKFLENELRKARERLEEK